MTKTVWIIDKRAINGITKDGKSITPDDYVKESIERGFFIYDSGSGGNAPYLVTLIDGEKEDK